VTLCRKNHQYIEVVDEEMRRPMTWEDGVLGYDGTFWGWCDLCSPFPTPSDVPTVKWGKSGGVCQACKRTFWFREERGDY